MVRIIQGAITAVTAACLAFACGESPSVHSAESGASERHGQPARSFGTDAIPPPPGVLATPDTERPRGLQLPACVQASQTPPPPVGAKPCGARHLLASGWTQTQRFDPEGRETLAVDRDQAGVVQERRVSSFEADRPLLVEVSRADGSGYRLEWQYTLDDSGRPIRADARSSFSPRPSWTDYHYDAAGRLQELSTWERTDEVGQAQPVLISRETLTRAANGIAVRDELVPSNQWAPFFTRTYDDAGRLLSDNQGTNGEGHTDSYVYDALGRVDRIDDRGPGGGWRQTFFYAPEGWLALTVRTFETSSQRLEVHRYLHACEGGALLGEEVTGPEWLEQTIEYQYTCDDPP